MRIRSDGEIPRFDLVVLRQFVPALWAEWDALRFDPGGRLLDPDTGTAFDFLQLTEGVHRSTSARYTLSIDPPVRYSFTLAEDDGRTVRGTVAGPPGSTRIAIGDRVSAAGHGTVEARDPYSLFGGPLAGAEWTIDVTTGDRWSAAGNADVAGQGWSAGLSLGARWHATARIDVRTLLLANDVPRYAIPLIGGREATVELYIDPAVIGRHGDLVTGRARIQRATADGVVEVRAKSDVWRCRITLHLHGRGLIGRSALLAARPAVRRAVRQGFTEFWADLASQATEVKNSLAALERDAAAAGGPAERLHRELWEGARDADRENRAAAVRAVAAPKPDGGVAPARRRWQRYAVAAAAVLASLAVIALVLAIVVSTVSSRGGSADPDPDSTPPLHIRQVTVAAFAGTDLQPEAATAAIVDGNRLVPDGATSDLTGRDTATIWNTATKATAPGGTVYDVFVLAVDLKSDPHHPSAAPTFADSQALGTAVGLGAGWRGTTELGPLTGPPWYPSATNLTGHTLLIIHLNVVPGADAELRRLTSQLSLLLRQRYIAATRP